MGNEQISNEKRGEFTEDRNQRLEELCAELGISEAELCGKVEIEGTFGMLETLRRRAREGGSYLVPVTLARNCSWLQDFALFPASEVHGVGLPEN